MSMVWILLSLIAGAILGIALLGASALLAQHYPLAQQLSTFFLNLDLPMELTFDQYLLAAVGACILLIILVLGVCSSGLLAMASLVGSSRLRQRAHRAALDHAQRDLQGALERDHHRLIGLSATLTQRLDKSTLVHNILQAAKQLTSSPRLDSIVALWVQDFESDRIRFARGLRCDESFFTRQDFASSETPIAKLVSGQETITFDRWSDGFPFVKPEKMASLGQASGLLLVPLIIERTVLGVLTVFCHGDTVKSYAREKMFFNAAWGQLSLALGISIQEELAILDRLTGVANRGYFDKRLAQEIDRSNRYQLSMGVIMIDIDNFKQVNDQLGHPQGDVVLKIVARLIRKCIRAMDLVGRYGGEEFIVLLPETGLAVEAGAAAGPMVVAERIRAAVEEEFCRFQKPLSVTVSVGVTVRRFPEDRQADAKELLRVVDEQLYKAKTTGKNRVCLAVPDGSGPAVSTSATSPPASASPLSPPTPTPSTPPAPTGGPSG
jgi:diguanylate cyclase (GGDEF)-like protein